MPQPLVQHWSFYVILVPQPLSQMYANRPENKHPLTLNAWTACFLTPLLAPGRDFNWVFWFLVKCSPYVALFVTVFIQYFFILFIEQIVNEMKDTMLAYAYDEHVALTPSFLASVDPVGCVLQANFFSFR